MTPQELEDCREVFHEKMKGYLTEFKRELEAKYKSQTVIKYHSIAYAFVEYIYGYTDIIRFEDMKKSDTNSNFISTMKWKELYDFDKSEIQSKIKVFLVFLKEQGLENDKVFK